MHINKKLSNWGDSNPMEVVRKSETIRVATWTHDSTKEEGSESSKKKREASGRAFRPEIEKRHEGSRRVSAPR